MESIERLVSQIAREVLADAQDMPDRDELDFTDGLMMGAERALLHERERVVRGSMQL